MNLPEEFLAQCASMGVAAMENLSEALKTEPTVSVRFNATKGCEPAEGADCVPWCRGGCYLTERPAFTFEPELHQGLYYVQDASSMFLRYVVEVLTANAAPVRYLDACAAPGGKTTAALDVLPKGSLVVANEYVPTRAAVLRENLTKWGVPCAVRSGDTARFAADGAVFDLIAADVPCSGEGMMRKDAKAVEQWSPELVVECVARQRQIIDNLWPALAPGGYMIYSTCTFNRAENEEMVQYMMERYGAEPVEISINAEWGIIPAVGADFPAYRFIPGAVRGEGLFLAVVRKSVDDQLAVPASQKQRREKPRKGGGKEKQPVIPKEVTTWLKPDSGAVLKAMPDGSIKALFPMQWPDFPYIPELEVATVKGRDLIPSHDLAMSIHLNREAFACQEVDEPTALEYLHCQSITLPGDAPRGIVLLTHNDKPLGFVKNIGSRANNLYPRSWRILKDVNLK